MRNQKESFLPLTLLIGVWEGQGTGKFPTIEPFIFLDRMTFTRLPGEFSRNPLIHFEEIAWVKASRGWEFKHWETGFLQPIRGHDVELQSIHNNGRFEILRGSISQIEPSSNNFEATLKAIFTRNAEGLETASSSARVLRCSQDVLIYSHAMSTGKIPELTNHLTIELRKVDQPATRNPAMRC